LADARKIIFKHQQRNNGIRSVTSKISPHFCKTAPLFLSIRFRSEYESQLQRPLKSVTGIKLMLPGGTLEKRQNSA
jgi:hypothetical protein